MRRQHHCAAVARTEDDAAPEPEPHDDAVEDDPCLAHRVDDGVQLRAELDERLHVRAPQPELALVQRGERAGGKREQPEARDVEHRHPLELDALAGITSTGGTSRAAWA